MKIQNNIAEENLNDEIERLINENECQRQDIDQLQFTNKILEEHIYINNIGQNNNRNYHMQAKEKRKKNDKIKGMEMLKKKNGINSKPIYF